MSHLLADVDGICYVDHEVGDKTPVELRFVAREGENERDVQHTRCNTHHHQIHAVIAHSETVIDLRAGV